MEKIIIERYMPVEKDFRIIINNRRQGCVMYCDMPIAKVGYNTDRPVGKTGWFYKITEFDVISIHDNLEDIFREIYRLVKEKYTFSHFICEYYVRFSPNDTEHGYDSYTYINGNLECTRMPQTIYVGHTLYEQIGDNVKDAHSRLLADAKRMLKDNAEQLRSIAREIDNEVRDLTIWTDRYKDIEAINCRIAKDIANIRSSILNIKY